MRVEDPADGFVVRLDDILTRLAASAEGPPPTGRTEPDQPSGERWEAGQVWAHIVEFVPYWIEQAKQILESDSDQPVPFGRIKTDPVRIAGIEAGRHEPIPVLWQRLSEEIGDLKAFLASLSDDDWRRTRSHQTLGVMDVERMVDRFLVGHLEEHADQLEGLTERTSSGGAATS
jgi:hypothetical protein